MQPTDLTKDLTKPKLKALAADLSALVGQPVSADGASVVVALGKIPEHERAELMASHGLSAPAEAPNSPAEAIADEAGVKAGGGIMQRILSADKAPAPKKPARAEADPFEGEDDAAEVWQLVGGPGRALSAVGASGGDLVVRPTDEVKALFAGCQRARLTVAEARELVRRGRGRIGKGLARANEASAKGAERG